MKAILSLLGALVFLLSGCAYLRKDIYVFQSQFYFGSEKIIEESSNGFSAKCPETWTRHYSKDGLMLGIHDYASSPYISFSRLDDGVSWQTDVLAREKKLSRDTRIESSESLTSYDKFSGHGIRRSGFNTYFAEKYAFVVFYPDGEMSGTRIEITFHKSPNKISQDELASIIRSAKYTR